ncbi:MAG: hypothetical protein ACO2PL_11330 [Armatimonadota bacterium]|jgi:hypothetical protein
MTPVLEIADTELRDYFAANLGRIQELFRPAISSPSVPASTGRRDPTATWT